MGRTEKAPEFGHPVDESKISSNAFKDAVLYRSLADSHTLYMTTDAGRETLINTRKLLDDMKREGQIVADAVAMVEGLSTHILSQTLHHLYDRTNHKPR